MRKFESIMLLALAVACTAYAEDSASPAASAASPPPAKQQSETLLSCMRANLPLTYRTSVIELQTQRRGVDGPTLHGEIFAMREPTGAHALRTMLRVSAPDFLAGAAYLARETADQSGDLYIYLPAFKRVRRITGKLAAGSLMDTAFSYADFEALQSTFAGMRGTLERTQDLGGRTTDVVHFKAAPGSEQPVYSAMRVWVDRTTCVPLMADFYQGAALRKQLITPAAGLLQADKTWYPSQIEMHDLRDNTHSVLRVTSLKNNDGLPARYFEPAMFWQPDPPPN